VKRLFLILFLVFYSGKTYAQTPSPLDQNSLFYQELSREVGRALKKRDGLVLWMDRERGDRQVFGNSALLSQSYLPGSLLKLVTAELALKTGRRWTYHCTGQDKIGGKIRHCWTYRGHGTLDLAQALGQSCNLFFSWVGTQLGYASLREALIQQGFAAAASLPASSDLASIPADLAIGDYPAFTVTPQEMADFWLRYLDRISNPDLAPIRQGLQRAVHEGTAKQLGRVDLQILGKTGTGDALTTAYPTNGWFLAAYPVEKPRWVLLVFLKEAHGFDEAAGLAEKIFRLANLFEVFNRK